MPCNLCCRRFGWQSVFYLFALLGLVWCAAWPLFRPEQQDSGEAASWAVLPHWAGLLRSAAVPSLHWKSVQLMCTAYSSCAQLQPTAGYSPSSCPLELTTRVAAGCTNHPSARPTDTLPATNVAHPMPLWSPLCLQTHCRASSASRQQPQQRRSSRRPRSVRRQKPRRRQQLRRGRRPCLGASSWPGANLFPS